MPYSVSYDPATECLMCRISGDVDPSLEDAFTDETLSLWREHGYKRLLNDLREANLKLSTPYLYFLPKRLEVAGFNRLVKRALVVSRAEIDVTCFEEASYIRGHQVKIFRDPEEAKQWLMKAP